MHLRILLLSYFGAESEFDRGCCLQYFDQSSMLNMIFGSFFNPKQVLLTIFGHSKVRERVVNHASKGTFVIVFWSRIRMWWRTFFAILWSQNPSILCWTWFLAIFQSQAGPEKQHVPLGLHRSLHNWSAFNPKIDIFEIFIDLWLYY